MPKSKDFKPNTDKCFRCGKTFVPSPHGGDEAVLCRACASIQRRTVIDKKGKVSIKHFAQLKPKASPADLPLLTRLARGQFYPEFLYTRAWERRKGRCSACCCRRATLRIVPSPHKVFIKSLLCASCYKKRQNKEAQEKKARKPQASGLSALMWAKADAFTRAMLANNPTFLEMAKADFNLPATPEEVDKSNP